MGRKSSYTPELGEKICEHVRRGTSIADIAAIDEMPAESTMHEWLNHNDAFMRQFFDAKRIAAVADQESISALERAMIQAALTAPKDRVSAVVNAYNNVIHSRKWKAAVGWRERYGEKVQAEVSGELNISLADAISKARKRRDEC